MAKNQASRKPTAEHCLKLPDLEQAKLAPLNSLTPRSSQRTQNHATREFIESRTEKTTGSGLSAIAGGFSSRTSRNARRSWNGRCASHEARTRVHHRKRLPDGGEWPKLICREVSLPISHDLSWLYIETFIKPLLGAILRITPHKRGRGNGRGKDGWYDVACSAPDYSAGRPKSDSMAHNRCRS